MAPEETTADVVLWPTNTHTHMHMHAHTHIHNIEAKKIWGTSQPNVPARPHKLTTVLLGAVPC